MSEFIKDTLENSENKDRKNSRESFLETMKGSLFENLDFEDGRLLEGDYEKFDKYEDELAINHFDYDSFSSKELFSDEDYDLFCFYDLDNLKRTVEQVHNVEILDKTGHILTYDEALELINKFWIFMDETKQKHKREEIKKKWNIIKNRRGNITILSHIPSDEHKINIDILNDWPKIEKRWLTDDMITLGTVLNIRDMFSCMYTLNIDDLKIATKLTRKEIRKVIDIIKTCNSGNVSWSDFLKLNKLTPLDIEKAQRNANYLWLSLISPETLIILSDISDVTLDYCAKNGIKKETQIDFVKSIYELKDKAKYEEYIIRKNEYLTNNKTISDEEFVEYFWKKWKHWKQWIRQWKYGLCYMYSTLETLTKMNWFDELMQTNLIKNDEWWIVRIPFQTWLWIQVWKNEIDSDYSATDNSPESALLRDIFGHAPIRVININSNTESLWIKILEIACIKNMLINGKSQCCNWKITKKKLVSNIKKWRWTIKDPLNLTKLTGDMLVKTEYWVSIASLIEIMWKWNVKFWRYDAIHDLARNDTLKRLKEIRAPEFVINLEKISTNLYGKFKEITFNHFMSWFLSIYVSVDCDAINKLWKWVKMGKKRYIINDEVKVLDRTWKKISGEKLADKPDLSVDDNWNHIVKFFGNHSYSVERCYINEKWEKRMRIINPWYTEIKFDVPFDWCKDNFEWEIWIINFDNLFR